MYRNVVHKPDAGNGIDLKIDINPGLAKFAGYQKLGNSREVFVATGPGHYNQVRRIDFAPQRVLPSGSRTGSFDWDVIVDPNTGPASINDILFGTPPQMYDIIYGKIGSSVSLPTALFFTNFSGGNYFGAVKFDAPQGYPELPLPDSQGEFGSGDRIVSENGLQVASSRQQFKTFTSLAVSGSTFDLLGHGLVDGQYVQLIDDITDSQCGDSTGTLSGGYLKVFEVNGTKFKLKTLGGAVLTETGSCVLRFTARSFYAMRTTNNDHQTNLKINTGSHKTIPMYPYENAGKYDTISKILLDAPTSGKTTVVSLDFEASEGSALVTKCDQVGAAAGCTNPQSYRIPATDNIKDADILVGDGDVGSVDPILLVVNANGVMRYSLGASAGTILTTVLLPSPVMGTIVSAKIRSLRLRDQEINRSNEALLYVEHGSFKDVYRTRDAGANWYKVHRIPSTNTILDIIPAHAHTKNDDGRDHWEPSFLMLEKTSSDLRVIGQDWHGY
jgi:hypothetical protein